MQNDRGNNRLRRESRQVGLCWDVTAALVKYTHCYMHGPDYYATFTLLCQATSSASSRLEVAVIQYKVTEARATRVKSQ